MAETLPAPLYIDESSVFLLIHDAPLFITRLPSQLAAGAEEWTAWLVDMEREWQRRNGGILQVSYKGSNNAYSLLKEARRAGGAPAAFATKLVGFLRDRWLVMQREVRENNTSHTAPPQTQH